MIKFQSPEEEMMMGQAEYLAELSQIRSYSLFQCEARKSATRLNDAANKLALAINKLGFSWVDAKKKTRVLYQMCVKAWKETSREGDGWEEAMVKTLCEWFNDNIRQTKKQ